MKSKELTTRFQKSLKVNIHKISHYNLQAIAKCKQVFVSFQRKLLQDFPKRFPLRVANFNFHVSKYSMTAIKRTLQRGKRYKTILACDVIRTVHF